MSCHCHRTATRFNCCCWLIDLLSWLLVEDIGVVGEDERWRWTTFDNDIDFYRWDGCWRVENGRHWTFRWCVLPTSGTDRRRRRWTFLIAWKSSGDGELFRVRSFFLQKIWQNTSSSIDEPIANLIDRQIGATREIGFFVVGRIGIVAVLIEPVLQDSNLNKANPMRMQEKNLGTDRLTLSFGRLARRFFNLDDDDDEELAKWRLVLLDDDDERIEFDELSRSQSESDCSLGRWRSLPCGW